MKKLVIVIILAMLAKYLYQQPEFKSWIDTHGQNLWSSISSQFVRPSYKEVEQQLLLIENKMTSSEQRFRRAELITPEQTQAFFQRFCQGYQSMHRVLTDNSRRQICDVLASYYQPQ